MRFGKLLHAAVITLKQHPDHQDSLLSYLEALYRHIEDAFDQSHRLPEAHHDISEAFDLYAEAIEQVHEDPRIELDQVNALIGRADALLDSVEREYHSRLYAEGTQVA